MHRLKSLLFLHITRSQLSIREGPWPKQKLNSFGHPQEKRDGTPEVTPRVLFLRTFLLEKKFRFLKKAEAMRDNGITRLPVPGHACAYVSPSSDKKGWKELVGKAALMNSCSHSPSKSGFQGEKRDFAAGTRVVVPREATPPAAVQRLS